MTYKDLLAKLSALSEEQLEQTVTVYDANNDETYGCQDTGIVGTEDEQDLRPDGVLDDGHFYLITGI
jgi:hypothetical protein